NVPWKKPTNGAGPDARPRPEIGGEASRRAHPSHHCWRIFTCAGLCWGGRSSALRRALAIDLSSMLMTSFSCARVTTTKRRCTTCEIMVKLTLTVNEDKTQICTVPEG